MCVCWVDGDHKLLRNDDYTRFRMLLEIFDVMCVVYLV